jgi:hypothetical protein
MCGLIWHEPKGRLRRGRSVVYQAIGSFSLATLAEFADIVAQAMALPATAPGSRLARSGPVSGDRSGGCMGTGIGCFSDNTGYELLGLNCTSLQTLYYFTVGRALIDECITTLPPMQSEWGTLYRE